jgi:hypothetical protein
MDNKYISKYSNNKSVSAAQYITELICENKAKKDKTDLHFRFWTSKKWEMYYKNQISSAHKLLKKYEAKSIIKALRSKAAEKIYSLRAPHLIPIIEQEQSVLQSENQNLSLEIDRKDKKTFRKNTNKLNIISKLKDLDYDS